MTMMLVTRIVPGDYVDLQGDLYADPNNNHPEYETDYQMVLGAEQEMPGCIRLDFGMDSVGFPANHMLWVQS